VLTRPDLVIAPGSLNVSEATPTVGSLVQVGLSVTNLGQTAAHDIYLQLYVDGVPVGQPQFLTYLAPGEVEPFTVLWQTNMSGQHVISALVDFTHVVDETREDNNGAQITVQVEQIHYKTTPALPYPWVLLALAAVAALAIGAGRLRARGRAGE
jgi:subtilase family serine protease